MKQLIIIAGVWVLLLILGSCKKEKEIEEPEKVHVDISFANETKPEPGAELFLNFYYTDEEDEPFYTRQADEVIKHTLGAQDIANGVTLTVDAVVPSPFIYLTAYVDVDGDEQLSNGDMAVCYSELSLTDVMKGLKTAKNASGRSLLTMRMDRVFESFQQSEIEFAFPEPPEAGTELFFQAYYADDAEPEFFNREPDMVVAHALTANDIADKTTLLVNMEDRPYIYASAYLDMDGNGELSDGDMAVVYNGKSMNAVLEGEATADNIAGLESVTVAVDAWFVKPVTDIDGNTYTTVVIGGKEWMVENLKVTRYANGDPIATGLSDSEWGTTTEGAYAVYPFSDADGMGSEAEMIAKYGLLYNGYAAMDARGLAPEGWRVANDDDFRDLEIHAGFSDAPVWGWRGPGGLKLRSSTDWLENGGTDDFGFNALPAGVRTGNGSFGGFQIRTMFWSELQADDPASERMLRRTFVDDQADQMNRNRSVKKEGASIRCVRDVGN